MQITFAFQILLVCVRSKEEMFRFQWSSEPTEAESAHLKSVIVNAVNVSPDNS